MDRIGIISYPQLENGLHIVRLCLPPWVLDVTKEVSGQVTAPRPSLEGDRSTQRS